MRGFEGRGAGERPRRASQLPNNRPSTSHSLVANAHRHPLLSSTPLLPETCPKTGESSPCGLNFKRSAAPSPHRCVNEPFTNRHPSAPGRHIKCPDHPNRPPWIPPPAGPSPSWGHQHTSHMLGWLPECAACAFGALSGWPYLGPCAMLGLRAMQAMHGHMHGHTYLHTQRYATSS